MNADDLRNISDAWVIEGLLAVKGERPPADKELQDAIIPPGGDWSCVAAPGAATRSISCNGTEIALMNPRGDMTDQEEAEIAMGFRASPVLDTALRIIFVLAMHESHLDLIRRIARAAVDYAEQPAPPIIEPEEDDQRGED